jgi:hypothetical protein
MYVSIFLQAQSCFFSLQDLYRGAGAQRQKARLIFTLCKLLIHHFKILYCCYKLRDYVDVDMSNNKLNN